VDACGARGTEFGVVAGDVPSAGVEFACVVGVDVCDGDVVVVEGRVVVGSGRAVPLVRDVVVPCPCTRTRS
jgi:hypothetical protein